MAPSSILVAGIGNIFLGDDGFGVEVAHELAQRPLPDGVRVMDFGIRGLDLAYALMDGSDAVILIDAVSRGGRPGCLYLLEPELDGTGESESVDPTVEAHALDPCKVLHLALALGCKLEHVWLVGCEPEPLAPDEMRMELSSAVSSAVPEAISMVEALITQLRADDHIRETPVAG
jgi:hydrogenase maturation protease